MRIVFLGAIPVITAFIGYLISAKYSSERDFWKTFVFTHKRIKNEVAFSQKPIPEILSVGNSEDKSENSDIFSLAVKNYINGEETPVKVKFLTAEQNEFFSDYLSNLGKTDKKSQLDFLNSAEERLYYYEKKSDERCKRYRPLFVKLGFLFGLILFILLV